jgi:hypothetical protein
MLSFKNEAESEITKIQNKTRTVQVGTVEQDKAKKFLLLKKKNLYKYQFFK